MAIPNQLLTFFIPETEGEGFQAPKEGHRFDRLEKRLGFVAFFQVIIRYARAKMVDVMEANVAGKPLQHSRQLVERTPLHGGGCVIPFLIPLPINTLELMLDVEQPYPGRSGHHRHR